MIIPGACGRCTHSLKLGKIQLVLFKRLGLKRKTIDEKLITLQSNSQGCHERNELRNDGLRKQPQRGIEFVKIDDIRRIMIIEIYVDILIVKLSIPHIL